MQVGYKTDKGKYRKNNEDACYVLLPDKVFVICDGVGGGNSGEIASRLTVDEISSYIKKHPLNKLKNKEEIITYFHKLIDDVNKVVFNRAITCDENTGMATTLVLFYINDDKAYIANVGDSRAYIFRDNVLQQLTEDHTYVNTLVKAGVMTKEQAQNDSRKNMITKAVGAEKTIEPDYYMIDINLNDIFMICTDGLYDEVNDLEIAKVFKEEDTMKTICEKLIDKANNNGGHDNITVVCAKVTEEDLNER